MEVVDFIAQRTTGIAREIGSSKAIGGHPEGNRPFRFALGRELAPRKGNCGGSGDEKGSNPNWPNPSELSRQDNVGATLRAQEGGSREEKGGSGDLLALAQSIQGSLDSNQFKQALETADAIKAATWAKLSTPQRIQYYLDCGEVLLAIKYVRALEAKTNPQRLEERDSLLLASEKNTGGYTRPEYAAAAKAEVAAAKEALLKLNEGDGDIPERKVLLASGEAAVIAVFELSELYSKLPRCGFG
jgi:hypothetical protein